MMSKQKTSLGSSPDNNYKENVNLSIEWNRWILKPMGVWPRSRNVSKLRRCFTWLTKAVCYSLIIFLVISFGLLVSLEVEDVYNKLKLSGSLIFCVIAFVKYSSLMIRENEIRECMRRIEWDWRNAKHHEDQRIMMANAIFGRRLVKICAFFMFSGFVFYYVAIPISVGRITYEGTNRTFLPLIFPVPKMIANTHTSPTNEIILSVQFLAGIVLHVVAVGCCSLAAVFAAHVCGQMEILMCWLGHLVDGRDDMSNNMNGRVASIVSQHVRILKFLTLVERTITQISLVEFFGSTLDVCLLGYYVIVEWTSREMTTTVTYAVLLVSLIFNVFIFCYIGELVAEQCRKVGVMSYMIDWYRLPEKNKLSLVLIMAMSNSSMKLTAGSLVQLSLTTFSDVVKTSVAFLNMLRTFA